MLNLVTGASGFLGGRLTQLLCARGERVRVLLRQAALPAHLEGLPGLEVAHGSLDEPASLSAAVRDATVIHHCGGCAKDWAPWSEFEGANIAGVRNLLAAVAQGGGDGLERLVHVSTTDVYGYPADARACTEDSALADRGLPYSRSKGQGDRLMQDAIRQGELPITIVRPATIYGPRSKDFVQEIGKLLRAGEMVLIGGGRKHGGLIFVDDVAEAMIKAAVTPAARGRIYNLGPLPEADTTWADYVRRLAEGLGVPAPRRSIPYWLALGLGWTLEGLYGLLRRLGRPLVTRHAVHIFGRGHGFPVDRAVADLGYQPRVPLDEGIARSVAWLRGVSGR